MRKLLLGVIILGLLVVGFGTGLFVQSKHTLLDESYEGVAPKVLVEMVEEAVVYDFEIYEFANNDMMIGNGLVVANEGAISTISVVVFNEAGAIYLEILYDTNFIADTEYAIESIDICIDESCRYIEYEGLTLDSGIIRLELEPLELAEYFAGLQWEDILKFVDEAGILDYIEVGEDKI